MGSGDAGRDRAHPPRPALRRPGARGGVRRRLVAGSGPPPRLLGRARAHQPALLSTAATGGDRLDGPGPHAWRFTPLPRVPLAACLWPGDDELPSQASVLFDANAGHHLPIDGLALLGAGLTGRLLRAHAPSPRRAEGRAGG